MLPWKLHRAQNRRKSQRLAFGLSRSIQLRLPGSILWLAFARTATTQPPYLPQLLSYLHAKPSFAKAKAQPSGCAFEKIRMLSSIFRPFGIVQPNRPAVIHSLTKLILPQTAIIIGKPHPTF